MQGEKNEKIGLRVFFVVIVTASIIIILLNGDMRRRTISRIILFPFGEKEVVGSNGSSSRKMRIVPKSKAYLKFVKQLQNEELVTHEGEHIRRSAYRILRSFRHVMSHITTGKIRVPVWTTPPLPWSAW